MPIYLDNENTRGIEGQLLAMRYGLKDYQLPKVLNLLRFAQEFSRAEDLFSTDPARAAAIADAASAEFDRAEAEDCCKDQQADEEALLALLGPLAQILSSVGVSQELVGLSRDLTRSRR